MLRVIVALAALAAATTAVLAQNTAAITQRKDAMKALGGATKDPTAMAKGEAPFDLAKVQASLKTLESAAAKGKTVFPDDSKDGDTAALPAAFLEDARRGNVRHHIVGIAHHPHSGSEFFLQAQRVIDDNLAPQDRNDKFLAEPPGLHWIRIRGR